MSYNSNSSNTNSNTNNSSDNTRNEAIVYDPRTGSTRTLHLSQSEAQIYQKAGYTVITQDKVYSNNVQLNPLQERVFIDAIQKPPSQRSKVEQAVVSNVESQLGSANMPYKVTYTQADASGTYVASVQSETPVTRFSTSSQSLGQGSNTVNAIAAIGTTKEEWQSAMQNTMQLTAGAQYAKEKAQTLETIKNSSLPQQVKAQVYNDVLYDRHASAVQRLQDYYQTETQKAIIEVAKSKNLSEEQKYRVIGYIAGDNSLDYVSQYERAQDVANALARIDALYKAKADMGTADMNPQPPNKILIHGIQPSESASSSTMKVDRLEEAKKQVDEFIKKNNLHLSEEDRQILIITLANKGEITSEDLKQLAESRLQELGFVEGFGHTYVSNIPILSDLIYSFAPESSRQVKTYLELSKNADMFNYQFNNEFAVGASAAKVYQVGEMIIGGIGLTALAKQGIQAIKNPKIIADIFKRATVSQEGLTGESSVVIKERGPIMPTIKQLAKGMLELDVKANIQALKSKPQYHAVDIAQSRTPATPQLFVQKGDIEVIDVRTVRPQEITKSVESLKLQRVEEKTAKSLAEFYSKEAFTEGKAVIEKTGGLPTPLPQSKTQLSLRPGSSNMPRGVIPPEEYYKSPTKTINEIISKKDLDMAEPMSSSRVPKGVIPKEDMPITKDIDVPAQKIKSKDVPEGITPFEELPRREQAIYSEDFNTPPTTKTNLKYKQVEKSTFDELARYDTDYNTAILAKKKKVFGGEGFAYEFIRYPEHSEPAVIQQFETKPHIEWKEDEKIYIIDITENSLLEKIDTTTTTTRTTDISITKPIDITSFGRDITTLKVFNIPRSNMPNKEKDDTNISQLLKDITDSTTTTTTQLDIQLEQDLTKQRTTDTSDQIIKYARITKDRSLIDSLFPSQPKTKHLLNKMHSKQIKYTFEDVFSDL